MKVLILFLFCSIFLNPCKAQQLVWSKIFGDSSQLRYLGPVQVLSNGDILAAGGVYTNNFESQFIKFDSLGNLLWIKNVDYDTLDYSTINFFESIREEPDQFYVGGKIFQNIPPANYDFIAKVDSAGDTLWLRKFPYFTFYNTTVSSSVLYDKSIITVGQLTTSNDANIIYRRLDSAGNLLWEKIHSNLTGQNANDIIELYDGSYLIIGQEINGVIFLLRININGDLVQTKFIQSNIQPSNGIIGRLKGLYLPDKRTLLCGSDAGNFPSQGNRSFIFIDENLDTLNSVNENSQTLLGPFVLSNSNIFFDTHNFRFPKSTNFEMRTKQLDTLKWDTLLNYSNGNDILVTTDYTLLNQNAFITGTLGYGFNGNSDYWLGKVENIGSEWIPDPCELSPPAAGFYFEYNYPVLTLRDSSFSGLQYHDTVYTWQWNTSVGTSGNEDSLLVFFDTAISKTLGVELIISNWYECSDTVNVTLNFDPSGISIEKSLEVKVYPNPVSDYLNIEFSEVPGDELLFELYDIQGAQRKVSHLNGGKMDYGLRISDLPSGIYFYRISSGSKVQRGKIVKQ